jgi:glycopeptide antibiotics resistance protein
MLLTCIFILFFRATDKGDGKRKRIANILFFGPFQFLEAKIDRPLSKKEKIGFVIVISFMLYAFWFH